MQAPERPLTTLALTKVLMVTLYKTQHQKRGAMDQYRSATGKGSQPPTLHQDCQAQLTAQPLLWAARKEDPHSLACIKEDLQYRSLGQYLGSTAPLGSA